MFAFYQDNNLGRSFAIGSHAKHILCASQPSEPLMQAEYKLQRS